MLTFCARSSLIFAAWDLNLWSDASRVWHLSFQLIWSSEPLPPDREEELWLVLPPDSAMVGDVKNLKWDKCENTVTKGTLKLGSYDKIHVDIYSPHFDKLKFIFCIEKHYVHGKFKHYNITWIQSNMQVILLEFFRSEILGVSCEGFQFYVDLRHIKETLSLFL